MVRHLNIRVVLLVSSNHTERTRRQQHKTSGATSNQDDTIIQEYNLWRKQANYTTTAKLKPKHLSTNSNMCALLHKTNQYKKQLTKQRNKFHPTYNHQGYRKTPINSKHNQSKRPRQYPKGRSQDLLQTTNPVTKTHLSSLHRYRETTVWLAKRKRNSCVKEGRLPPTRKLQTSFINLHFM